MAPATSATRSRLLRQQLRAARMRAAWPVLPAAFRPRRPHSPPRQLVNRCKRSPRNSRFMRTRPAQTWAAGAAVPLRAAGSPEQTPPGGNAGRSSLFVTTESNHYALCHSGGLPPRGISVFIAANALAPKTKIPRCARDDSHSKFLQVVGTFVRVTLTQWTASTTRVLILPLAR
jgi:hypothetical protein